MKPEAQRIAIAEACGWRGPKHPDTIALIDEGMNRAACWWLDPHGKLFVLGMGVSLPDYLTDLNAMHEAEKVLGKDDLQRFCEALFNVVTRYGEANYSWPSVVIHVTAAQRAEAFLRTLGKWTDSPAP